MSAQEWETAHQQMLIEEKAFTRARDALAVYASRGSQPDLQRIKVRMGWHIPWYTMVPESTFDRDFGVHDWHGHNAFIRDGDRVFRNTARTHPRGGSATRTPTIRGRPNLATNAKWGFGADYRTKPPLCQAVYW